MINKVLDLNKIKHQHQSVALLKARILKRVGALLFSVKTEFIGQKCRNINRRIRGN